MRSMTGFGESRRAGEGLRLAVQVSSVNRRHLDLRLSVPRELTFLENDVRDLVRAALDRGAVQLTVEVLGCDDSGRDVHIDSALAAGYCRELRRLRDELGLAGDIEVRDLLAVPDLFAVEPPARRPEALKKLVLDAVGEALEALVGMRETEGAVLRADLAARLAAMGDMLAGIRALAPGVVEQYHQRLLDNVRDCAVAIEIDDERLVKEVAFFTDRADVSEEITRLGSHLEQAAALLDAAGAVGRKLDFLGQELVREINTIGSKCNDARIGRLVVDFKVELERVREQVQNIE